MHWNTIYLVFQREARDLIRDRRTAFMVFILPVALYPLLAFLGYNFARGMLDQESIVGIHGLEYLPKLSAQSARFSPVPLMGWLSMTAPGVDRVAGAESLFLGALRSQDYPPLIVNGTIPVTYFDIPFEADSVRLVPLPSADRAPLDEGKVDLIVAVPPEFRARLDAGGKAIVEMYYRQGDERSRSARRRMEGVFSRWQANLKRVRLLRSGLPLEFDEPLGIRRPQQEGEKPQQQSFDELSEAMARFFPFLLIMWALAGALHPAIDVTAGEKERGTLETLLLSPASRGEIVVGKFMAVWAFSAITALWNMVWVAGGSMLVNVLVNVNLIPFAAIFWCSVLTILLAALFSAVSMALGAYARSTKEGQYYLLPIFIVAMPLTFLPMLPGIELNFWTSLIPISGATLLVQRLMLKPVGQLAWPYFAPVLLSLAFWCAVSLRWAVRQFHREEVLFRDSSGLQLPDWVRHFIFPRKRVEKPTEAPK